MRPGKMSFAILLFLGSSLNSVTGQRPIFPDLPSPRLVLVGPTGSGKSSLANAFLGCDPRDDECMFKVCSSLDSCTKETTYGTGRWLGLGQNFTVVDTPGFGDSDSQDDQLIEEMMDVLANTLEHCDTMLLVLPGNIDRFNDGLQIMLKRMTLMFGEGWWDYMIIGVSFWAYDQNSIDDRLCDPNYPKYCKDEDWFRNEITTQLNEKFNMNKTFTFVFTDSWSQTQGPPGYNTNDTLQQEHWQAETKILWDITTGRDNSFDFMTINDFMEENARQKAEIKWLNDVITSNITELQEHIRNLEENLTFNITEMTERIVVNEAQIIKNTEQSNEMTERIVENEAQIIENTEQSNKMTERIVVNEAQIIENTKHFTYLEENLIPAVGSIIAWLQKGPTNNASNPISTPKGWQKCDGEPIEEESSPFYGSNTPNINGQGLFLRGGNLADATTVQEDMIKAHKHTGTYIHKHTGTYIHKHTGTYKHKHTGTYIHKHNGTHIHKHEISSATSNMYEHKPETQDPKQYSCYERQNANCKDDDQWMKDSDGELTIDDSNGELTIDDSDGELTIDNSDGKLTIDDSDGKLTIADFGGAETRPKNMAAVYIMRIF